MLPLHDHRNDWMAALAGSSPHDRTNEDTQPDSSRSKRRLQRSRRQGAPPVTRRRPFQLCVAQLVVRRRRPPAATSSAEPSPSAAMPVISIATTLAPVIGRELGVFTTFAPCTGGGLRVSFSPRTQVPSAPACWPSGQDAGGGVWHVPLTIVWPSGQPVESVTHWPSTMCWPSGQPLESVTHWPSTMCWPSGQPLESVTHWPLTMCWPSGQVVTGGLQPVCAGLLRPIPWLRSHS